MHRLATVIGQIGGQIQEKYRECVSIQEKYIVDHSEGVNIGYSEGVKCNS